MCAAKKFTVKVHHSEKGSLNAKLGDALKALGFRLYGYSEDRSEVVTDYYCPESWDGVATHTAFPGFVVICNPWNKPGHMPTKQQQAEQEECSLCNGTGIHPDSLNYQEACANPSQQHAQLWAKKDGAYLMFGESVVSPLMYRDDGSPKCLQCHGAGFKVTKWRTIELTDQQWPVWDPKNVLPRDWYTIQYNGIRIGGGTGMATVKQDKTAANTIANTIVDVIEGYRRRLQKQDTADTASTASTAEPGLNFTVSYERDWTWVQWPERPPSEFSDALAVAFSARWSRKRQAWYIQSTTEPDEIMAKLADAGFRQQAAQKRASAVAAYHDDPVPNHDPYSR